MSADVVSPLPIRLLLWHWGREGAGAKFTYELASRLRGLMGPALTLSSAAGSDLSRISEPLDGILKAPVSTFAGDKSSRRGKLSALLGLAKLPLTAWRFYHMIKDRRIDVALCTFQSIWDAATLPILARGSARAILIVHDAVFHPGDEYPFRQWVLRQQIRSTDGLIVLSDHVRRQVMAAFDYPADRIWKMPHGPFAFGSKQVAAARHPRGERDINLLFFGRIVAYKGLDQLLRALRLLTNRGLRVQLVIAGSGDLAPYADLLQTLSCVTIHNRWLTEEEIGQFLAASDVAVLPYSEASQSGVAGSAYAAGRPVVVTPVGGLVEQVISGKTGLIAREATAGALADAIAEFVEDPDLLDACAVGALAYAETTLNWRHGASVVAEAAATVHSAPRRQRLSQQHPLISRATP